MKTRKELIDAYINFFKSKDHKEIPNSSLVPLNDPTVLFTTAGMHPLVPYLLGQKHPLGPRLVNVQKCIRTGDIDEVGDPFHHTFFEMLGNWSLGDYWKEEAIEYSFEFLTKVLKIPKEKLFITYFQGDKNAPKDIESAELWGKLGIPEKKIIELNEDNWWGPAGETGPCGPSTEMFYSNKTKFDPNKSTLATDGKDWVEIWNDVFMQYNKTSSGYENLNQKNVDTGMGLERTLAVLNGFDDNYLTKVWQPIIKAIEKLSKKTYKEDKRAMRIIADHIKSAVMIINDGVIPSNVEQGYILRRLIRRAVRNLRNLGIHITERDTTVEIAKAVFPIYPDYNLDENLILEELKKEETRFQKTLEAGLKQLKKMVWNEKISGKDAFLLFQSYGFPIEMTEEIALESGSSINTKAFEKELKKHQKLSRTAAEGKFKSGLADDSEATTRLHTATHLLNEALRVVLGSDVKQRGSNINSERLRFDFNFDRKLTDEEKKDIEKWVNDNIKKALPVKMEELPVKAAFKSGAQGEFGAKYPDIVSVYTIGKNISKEICTGPHVKNTKEIGKFRIKKEESSAAGIRRIKAVVE